LIKPIFITSTGTNIGKTYLTNLLIKRAMMLNYRIKAIKPIISGFNINNLDESDSGIILKALGKNKSYLDKISPWRFETPLSPDMAANIAKRKINFKELINFCNSHIISKDEDILIIEGVGGTMVPINNKFTILDLMKRLDIPIILTIGSYLGTISHTLNAYEVLIKNNININSIVLNQSSENDVGIELTKDSLLNYIKNIPIHTIKRNHKNNNVLDKILENL
jgi:dethiobiotin synthetase